VVADAGKDGMRVQMAMAVVLLVGSAAGVQRQEQRVFVAMYERGPAWTGDAVAFGQLPIKGHIAYFKALDDRLIGAAPLRVQSGDNIIGMVVFVARNQEDAQTWLAADPAVKVGVMHGKVREWGVSTVRGFTRAATQ
jgi:uncharacterized protein YciI